MRPFASIFLLLASGATGLFGQTNDLVSPTRMDTPSLSFQAVDTAPSVPAKTHPLTITEALTLAEQNSPRLDEAVATVSRAQAGIQGAKAYANPNFEFLAGEQSARPVPTPGAPGTLLRYSGAQAIEIPSVRHNRIRASELNYDELTTDSKESVFRWPPTLREHSDDVVRRKEELAQSRDNLSLVEDLRRRVRLEVEVGRKESSNSLERRQILPRTCCGQKRRRSAIQHTRHFEGRDWFRFC